MISLVDKIPIVTLPRAEIIKINCNYKLYRDIALFWTQDDNKAIISMLDGDVTIYNNNANTEELREFINVISPSSVFSDSKTMSQLFGDDFHLVCVMTSKHVFKCDIPSQTANSSEIYKLLNVKGLELPPYEYFAVDFCHKLNRASLNYFVLKDICAAVGISDGHNVLVNGVASHKKGMGSTALLGLLAQYSCPAVAVCEKEIAAFYLKNNFKHCYNAGYWRKSS